MKNPKTTEAYFYRNLLEQIKNGRKTKGQK